MRIADIDHPRGGGPWVRLMTLAATADEDAPTVLAQITERTDGRRVINRLYVAGGELDLKALRAIPLDRLEMAINQRPDWPLETAPGPNETGEQHRLTAVGDELLLADGDKVPPVQGGVKGERPRLQRPDGSDPDAFYALVAEAYREALDESAPAQVLAEEAGVPVPTVHRWVREARRRGVLPPAKKRGRAG
ncbi:hypothetical protein [Actinomadura mexicana]|uniref:hypothetical protein n=1 Tax=Actinomadura mexicana TaxID=134959 RepID=UPI000B779201|nr:hypothetical protein [Actinomadura mexicana]